MTSHEATAFVLAQSDPGGQGEDFGKSSPVGLLLLILLLLAVVFLIWSMSRHLRRLPQRFDEERAAAAAPTRARSKDAGSTAVNADVAANVDAAADESTAGTDETDVEADAEVSADEAGASAGGARSAAGDVAGDGAEKRRD